MRKTLILIILSLIFCTIPVLGANWYVRPAGGNYGAEDGTSYANAWDGLLNVRWGAGGVDAGDTLYVCGTHILNMTSKTLYNQGSITPHSGDSDAARVTIRGDYGGDPGIVWGAFRPAYEAWVSEGSDTYSITTPADCEGVWIFQDISGASCRWLANKASVAACKALAGSYYYDAANRRYYVHRTDGAAPNNNVYIENYGYQFINTGGKRYITYLNIKLLAMGNNVWNDNDATHMTWDGVTFAYGNYALLKVMDNCDYFVIQNCDIGYAQNGIYTISDHAGGADYYTIKDNYIHDIGNTVRAILGNNDEHGIGVQGGNGGLIEGNHLQRCGNSILLYAYTNQTLTNTIVRYNFVEDGHAPTDATYCIALSTQMNADSIHNKTGNKFYYNIVVDQPGYGYRFQFGSLQEVYNNVAVNCKWSFATEMSWGGTPDQPAVKFHNNISLNPTGVYGGHMCFASASPDACWDSDYNIFYPDGAQSFRRSGTYTNFSGWKALGYDTHSRNANPLFDNPAGGDFHLQTNSPAIDAGVYVSLNRDHEGTSVPQGSNTDIGAYEYVFGANPLVAEARGSPTSGQAPLAVSFSGSASGGTSPYSYGWNFGDGQTSTSQNPSHTYSTAGNYSAVLTVTDNQDVTDTGSISISVTTAPAQLIATASASPTSGQAPLTVNFTGGATGGTPPYSYSWNFGDGGASSAQNQAHTYTAPGSYTTSLTVRDNSGASDTEYLNIIVTSAPHLLVATASATPTSGPAPLEVSFTGSAAGGAPPYSYSWSFGDGSTSSLQSPTYTYSISGAYTATLTVTDSTSSTAESIVSINVSTTSGYNLFLSSETGSPAPDQGGTTDPSPGNYSYNTTQTILLKSLPYSDYRFSRWKGDIVEANTFNAQTSVLIDTSKALSSMFCTKCADVNGDLIITPADAQAAFDIFLGRIPNPTWCEKENADVNSSGTKFDPKVTPADAQIIFKKYLKKGNTSGNCSGSGRAESMSVDSLSHSNVRLLINDLANSIRGQDIYLPIIIESDSDIGSFGFDLIFPSNSLMFVGLERTELTADYTQLAASVLIPPQLTITEEAGKFQYLGAGASTLRVGGYKTSSVEGPFTGVLVTLVFRLIGSLDNESPISVAATYDDIQNADISIGAMNQGRSIQYEGRLVNVSERRTAGKRYDN
jgi:PKD repeat protein